MKTAFRETLTHIAALVAGLLLATWKDLFTEASKALKPVLIEKTSIGLWIDASFVLSISCAVLLLIISLYLYWYFFLRLRLKYGIYWDRKKNPYCPFCKKPLSAIGTRDGTFLGKCGEHELVEFANGFGFKSINELKDSV